jgi:hypothetical protein
LFGFYEYAIIAVGNDLGGDIIDREGRDGAACKTMLIRHLPDMLRLQLLGLGEGGARRLWLLIRHWATS